MNTDQFNGHTPGPWDVIHDSRNDVVISHGGEETVCRLPHYPLFSNAQFKNAHLIAAAPDLLAELKRLRAALLTYQPPEGFEWDDIHPRFSRDDWLSYVASQDEYEPGYWEWVNFQIDIEEDEEE